MSRVFQYLEFVEGLVPPVTAPPPWGWQWEFDHFDHETEWQQTEQFITIVPPAPPVFSWLFDTGFIPEPIVRDEYRAPYFFGGARLGDPQPLPPWTSPSVPDGFWSSPSVQGASWAPPAVSAPFWRAQAPTPINWTPESPSPSTWTEEKVNPLTPFTDPEPGAEFE